MNKIAILLFVCVYNLCLGSAASETNPKWLPMTSADTPEQLAPDKGEMTVDQALEVAYLFLKNAGIDVRNTIPRVSRSSYNGERFKAYHFLFESAGDLVVSLDYNRVKLFSNSRRHFEQRKGKKTAGDPLYKDPFNSRSMIRKLALKLGMPEKYELDQFEYLITGDLNNFETRYAPIVKATFRIKPYGFVLNNRTHECLINVDPIDGTLMYYSLTPEWPYSIENKDLKLKREEALIKASEYVNKYGICTVHIVNDQGKPRFVDDKLPVRVSLELVCPNGQMNGVNYHPAQMPQKLRLAWVIRYQKQDQIWIDAADGKFLGGACEKWMIEQMRNTKQKKDPLIPSKF